MIPRIALLGCGKQKAATTCAAGEMYRSQLFRAALRWALVNCDQVFVLSAKHGLLRIDDVIEPYEETLPRDRAARLAWGSRVGAQIVRAVGEIEAELVVLAGERYEQAIHFDNPEWEYHWHTPLEGLGIGERIAWLKSGRVAWLYERDEDSVADRMLREAAAWHMDFGCAPSPSDGGIGD